MKSNGYLLLARDIIRKFVKNGETREPQYSTDWTFYVGDTGVHLKSEILGYDDFFSSHESFSKEIALNSDYVLFNNSLAGVYYLTSVGFISEQKFYEAQEFIELNTKKFKKEDLEPGEIYIISKGKEVIIIGELTLRYINNEKGLLSKKTEDTDFLLFSLEENRYIKLLSVKLVSFKDVLKEKIYLPDAFNFSFYTYFKEVENKCCLMDYSYMEKNELLSIVRSYDCSEDELNNFIKSNEKELKLELRKKEEEREISYNKKGVLDLMKHIEKLSGGNSYGNADFYKFLFDALMNSYYDNKGLNK